MGPNSALAEKFFSAAAAGDAEAMRGTCAPNMKWSQNGGPEADVEALIALGAAVRGVLSGYGYDNAVRSDTTDGFVEEHAVSGVLPDGTAIRVVACVVARVENGKIVHAREYFDSAAAAALFKALGG